MAQLSGKRSNRIFFLKIDLPALLAFALFAGLIFFYLIPGFEKAMMERKRILIHEITSSAYSILEYYHGMELRGTLTGDSAKNEARAAISAIRYGSERKDYFWITDRHPRMIVHPYRPDLNGKDLSDFHDSGGKKIFVEFVEAVSSAGESYVEYMWQWNDDSTRVVPKLSYVRLFEPWEWIIGTGIYIEDVRLEIRRMEVRALIISGIIAAIIIILLSVISKQSHKSEKGRSLAEEELRKSRELYRTLAEASSEGVLIWSENGLQANKTLISWLGFSEEELTGLNPGEIIISSEVEWLEDPAILYEELTTRRYVNCALKLKTGNSLMSYADFSRILLGGLKAVLIVIRPAGKLVSQSVVSPGTELVNDISTGFFKVSYGRKGRFLHASPPAYKMLGFNSMHELLSRTIESFFVNRAELKAFKLSLMAKENIEKKIVLLRRNDNLEFYYLISIVLVESGTQEIWCEGTIESLAVNLSQESSALADLYNHSASYIMDVPLSSVMRDPVECSETTTAGEAASIMQKKMSSFIMVTDSNREPLGIVGISDLVPLLADIDRAGTELFRLGITSPGFIHSSLTISDALGMLNHSRKKCLIVLSDDKNVTGMITSDELAGAFLSTPELIIEEIKNACDTETLRCIFLKFRSLAVSMIAGHADPYETVLFNSFVADAICRRVLTVCIDELGDPPCRFAFIQTGSAGRREQTLSTDQDNAIIFENCEEAVMAGVSSYFLALGRKVNEMLSGVGYMLCKGGKMAGNPLWCQPLNRWKRYFSDWIRSPGPSEILEMSIFFDFRFCYGDSSLSDELREYVSSGIRTSDIYFHHVASAWKQFATVTDLRMERKADIKRLIMPLTGIIRLYALRHGVKGFSTTERIIDLYSEDLLDHNMLRNAIKAWKDLTSLRLIRQAECLKGGVEPDNIIDFRLVNYDLVSYAEQAAETVNELMLKAGTDFFTDQI